MERKAVSPSGSSRTLGEKAGVTMATLRWSLGRTCAVLQHVHRTRLLLELEEMVALLWICNTKFILFQSGMLY
ncbi:hypothetical protein Pyn_08061 [Prunus yedoensis var. nudiflora]|uniref:Uncharacterized protein n=1 Tax=Prunus yedoensis var. nudiflora TaxID=2094558 RepID=A0A314YWE0_PRUYE|nr:hypothetical protein Pyn_08061 [Prunus yedoensis var. nudiflora]